MASPLQHSVAEMADAARELGAVWIAPGATGLTAIFATRAGRAAFRASLASTHQRPSYVLTRWGSFVLDYAHEWRDVNGYGVAVNHSTPREVPLRVPRPGTWRIVPVVYAWHLDTDYTPTPAYWTTEGHA